MTTQLPTLAEFRLLHDRFQGERRVKLNAA